MNQENQPAAHSTSPQSALQQFSNAQSLWHFVLLCIVTFGAYELYWFYHNWKHLKLHKNLDISPGWRTIGLSVPILNIVLIYRQLRDIRDFAKETGRDTYSSLDTYFSPGWIAFTWIFLTALALLPGIFSLLGYLSIWPLAKVQGVLNSYWKKEQPELIERTKFSGRQIALLVIGGIVWILLLITPFI